MQKQISVIDNFVDDPIPLRAKALKLDYQESGSYKGFRSTAPNYVPEIDQKLQQILGSKLEYVASSFRTHWTPAGTPCVAHADPHPPLGQVAGALYMDPNAPVSAGTAFFRHKSTGRRTNDPGEYDEFPAPYRYIDLTRYEELDYVANFFNRLVLWNGNLLHSMKNPYGYDVHTARLTMLFFVNLKSEGE